MESLYGSNWHEIELLLYLPLQKWAKKWKIREINHKKIWKNQGESRKSHKIEISYDVSKLLSFFEILVSYEMLLHVRFFSRLHQVHLKKNPSHLFKKLLFLRGQKEFRE